VKGEFCSADCEKKLVFILFPIENVINVENQVCGALALVESGESDAMNMHVVP